MIDHGKVIAEGTPGQLKASVGGGALHVRLLDPEQRPEAERVLASELGEVHLEPDPAALSVSCADPERGAEAVAELGRTGIGIADFSLGQPSLDEVFLALTGRPAEDEPAEEAAIGEEPGDMSVEARRRPARRRGRGAAQGARLDRAPAARERRLRRDHLRLARDAQGQARARAARST